MKLIKLLFLVIFSIPASAQIKIGADIDGPFQNSRTGHSVSLSSDGSTLAIGKGGSWTSSYVRVYEDSSGTWVQLGANILISSGINTSTNQSISLSSDGTILAVGATGNVGGKVTIHQYSNGSWSQPVDSIAGEALNDQSGYSVSLSSDGTVVAIGAPGNDGNGSESGHVRVYEDNSGTWVQLGADIDGEAQGDQSGGSVSLSSDGTVVAIGAPSNAGNGNGSGHVRVYEDSSGTWVQIGADIDGEAQGDQSGGSISLSSDGTIVAIGARVNAGNGNGSGHVRVYEDSSGTWVQLGADIDGEAQGDQSGGSVSLSSDGTMLAIGGSNNNQMAGHVRLYEYSNGGWSQLGADIDGQVAADLSGFSVSLSSDSSIVAIGAPIHDNLTGHVRVYYVPLCQEPYTSQVCIVTNDTSGYNQIIWEKPSKLGTLGYNIYRDGVIGYTKLTTIGVNQPSEFTDISVNPGLKAYKYYITALDSCGNEYGSSTTEHSTIHLQSGLGTVGEVNLVWTSYTGTTPLYYKIYRKAASNAAFLVLDSVSIVNNTYTDFNPPTGYTKYQVAAVMGSGCNSSSKTGVTSSLSNSTAQNTISIKEDGISSIAISPNPNTGYFSITLDQQQVGSVYRIIDNLGRLIDKGIITEQNQAFDLSDKPKGVYRIQVYNENMVKTLSVVIQ